jgi:hypothetical protein
VLPIGPGWLGEKGHRAQHSSEISYLAGAYRAAVIETNPKLLKQKIAGAEQAVISRLKQLENIADHHHELTAVTDALSALKILGETI